VILSEAVAELVGDYGRFGAMADRVEGLVEAQVSVFVPARSNWLVLPWNPAGGAARFYLFSEDREGQRRGKEVLTGFLGPAVATLVSVPDDGLSDALPGSWRETGLVKVSVIRRVGGPEAMLARLEDAAATLSGRAQVEAELQPNHFDLLRDVRLAMLGKDPAAAQRLLDQLILTGELSAENLRFLTIELLSSFGRWQEIADLPYIQTMMQARRSRSVTESILQMIWWTEVADGLGLAPVATVFSKRDLVDCFGGLLRAIQVPSRQDGRMLAFLTALFDEDLERQTAILDAADEDESAALSALIGSERLPEPRLEPEPEPELEPILAAFDLGKFQAVIDLFLAEPAVRNADLVVQAVLNLGVSERANSVLDVVNAWVASGDLEADRRLARDLTELEHLVSGACAGWADWAERLGGDKRWADAAAVLRNQSDGWIALQELPAAEVETVADGILNAVGSPNHDQLRSCLDILCRIAADVVQYPACAQYCDVVLEFLGDEENASAPVRDTYVTLFTAILEGGPSKAAYQEILRRTSALWDRIRSRHNVEWAIEILDAALSASSPDRDQLNVLGVQFIETARSFERLTIRQRVEIESLAPEVGLPSLAVEREAVDEGGPAWSLLDGTLVGLYSLLPQAVPRFTTRLHALCAPAEVRGNTDTTATDALSNLAERADRLVVDTWHAAHAATKAIDAARPRDRQILPRQRGVSGFIQALEDSLES